MRQAVVVALGVLAAGGVALPPDQRPTVGVGNATCDAPPAIVSYHVHAVWDASNASLSAAAREAFDAFAAAAGAPAGSCPFSHPNGAPGYAEVCAFPINWTAVLARQGAGPPDLLFGGDNFAFHVPVARLAEAEAWWRQRRGPLHVMLHANTGCAYRDHSDWATRSAGYPPYNQSLEGLWCCKQGPPGCVCDLVRYRVARSSSHAAAAASCLGAAPAPGAALGLAPCGDALSIWRETAYAAPPAVAEADAFRQLEAYDGDGAAGGGAAAGGGLCIAAAAGCEARALASLVPCRLGDLNASLASWDGDLSTTSAPLGRLRSDSCAGMCLAPSAEDATAIELLPCSSDEARAWERVFID